MVSVQLTPSAAKRIHHLAQRQADAEVFLRLAVESGGCSGLKYNFKLESIRAEDDVVVERDGAILVIDKASLPFLEGAVIDFVSDVSSERFHVKNPNAASFCGCGTSFAVKN